MTLTEYENGIVSVIRKRSLEEKKALLAHFCNNLNVDTELLKKWKNIDLDTCDSYKDILNKLYAKLTIIPGTVTAKPSIFSRINEGIFNTVVNHPYIIVSLITISLISPYIYRS